MPAPIDIPGQRLKYLRMKQIFEQETDVDHPLTMDQVIAKLDTQGITGAAHNATKKLDREVLRAGGVDIKQKGRTRPALYYVDPLFDDQELQLLVDSALATKFLPATRSSALVGKIIGLASVSQRALLEERIPQSGQLVVEGRTRTANRFSFENVGTVSLAMKQGKKVSFRYCEFDTKGSLVPRRAERYVRTAAKIVYQDGRYYALLIHDDHPDEIAPFRIDRMQEVIVEEACALKVSHAAAREIRRLQESAFSMYKGKEAYDLMELEVHRSAVNVVVDRFGKAKLLPVDDDWTRIAVGVYPSSTLYAWLFQLGSAVRVRGSQSLRAGYRAYVEEVARSLDEASPA